MPSHTAQPSNHLGNVRTVFKKNGGTAEGEGFTDYYPGGMQMPGRSLLGAEGYRYAFQGQEKDTETGKEAFALRLWDSRIGRWLTTDPAGQFSSPYLAMGNNPISMVDPDGGTCYDAQGNQIPCGNGDSHFEGSARHLVTGGDGIAIGMGSNTGRVYNALNEVVITPAMQQAPPEVNLGGIATGLNMSGALLDYVDVNSQLRHLALDGIIDQRVQINFLNEIPSNANAAVNVYNNEALSTISNLNKGIKFLGHTSNVLGYYGAAEQFARGNTYGGTVEATSNTAAIGIGYYLGGVYSLAWTGGWESGKHFWNNTEVGQDIAWRYLRFHLPDSKKPPQYRRSVVLGD